jgi:ABC-2 type transport system permease protein
MHGSKYLQYELVRTLRNRRLLVFPLGFPLLLFFTIAGPNRHSTLGGIPFPTYYMTGMAAWGTMTAVISSGARIAQERQIGWTRQMRITPLSVRSYFGAKVISGYLMAMFTIAVLYLAGSSLGVRLAVTSWFEMTGLILVGLIPLAVIGILLGHLLKVDSMGPAIGGVVTVFALFGGAWGPFATTGVLNTLVRGLPSYWLVQAGRTAFGGRLWPSEGWIVIAVWTVAMVRIAALVYQRDTARV